MMIFMGINYMENYIINDLNNNLIVKNKTFKFSIYRKIEIKGRFKEKVRLLKFK